MRLPYDRLRCTSAHAYLLSTLTWSMIFLAVVKPFEAEAQSYLGFSVGMNKGRLSGDELRTFKPKTNLKPWVSLHLDILLADDTYMTLRPSYMYSELVLEYEYWIDDVSHKVDSILIDYQCLALPIMLKLVSENQHFQFLGGFEFNFPTSAVADNSVEETDLVGSLNDVSVNMLFGMGYRIPVGRTRITVDVEYAVGLNNIAENLEDPDSLLPRMRYSSFRFMTAWLIPLKKVDVPPQTN